MDLGLELCRVVGVDPGRVRSLTLTAEVGKATRATVEFVKLVDDEIRSDVRHFVEDDGTSDG